MNLDDVSKGQKVRIFNEIDIETAALCNRKCVFCPNFKTARPDEFMPFELIKKVVDELAEVDYSGRIGTYIYNEPLRDGRFYEILAYITKTIPKACVMLNTNGDYLKDKEDLAKLYDNGVRQLNINIYSAADGCGNLDKEAKGVKIATKRADQIEGWIKDLNIDTKKSVYDYAPKGARRARVERKYGIQTDSKKLGQFELQNRSGNVDWFLTKNFEPLQKSCVRPFRVANVNWKGDMILCCNDYHGEVSFGNIRDRNIIDLWNDTVMHAYRIALQNNERRIPLCHNCDYSGGHYKHVISKVTMGSPEEDKKAIESIRIECGSSNLEKFIG